MMVNGKRVKKRGLRSKYTESNPDCFLELHLDLSTCIYWCRVFVGLCSGAKCGLDG